MQRKGSAYVVYILIAAHAFTYIVTKRLCSCTVKVCHEWLLSFGHIWCVMHLWWCIYVMLCKSVLKVEFSDVFQCSVTFSLGASFSIPFRVLFMIIKMPAMYRWHTSNIIINSTNYLVNVLVIWMLSEFVTARGNQYQMQFIVKPNR